MATVKVTNTDKTTISFKPAKGFKAEQIVKWMRQGKISIEGGDLVKPGEIPNEYAQVVGTITSVVSSGNKRTVELA